MLLAGFAVAVLAGIWPIGLAAILAYLDRAPPLAYAWTYLAGAASILTVDTTLILLVMSATDVAARENPGRSATVTLVLGLVALGFAGYLWRRYPRSRPVPPTGTPARPRGSRRTAYLLGVVMWLLPSPVYLVALKLITDAGEAAWVTALAGAVCIVLLLWIVEVPIALYLLHPVAVRRWLYPLNRWMARNGRTAVVVLIAGLGALLTVDGLAGLLNPPA